MAYSGFAGSKNEKKAWDYKKGEDFIAKISSKFGHNPKLIESKETEDDGIEITFEF